MYRSPCTLNPRDLLEGSYVHSLHSLVAHGHAQVCLWARPVQSLLHSFILLTQPKRVGPAFLGIPLTSHHLLCPPGISPADMSHPGCSTISCRSASVGQPARSFSSSLLVCWARVLQRECAFMAMHMRFAVLWQTQAQHCTCWMCHWRR
jgi:hypothetical protein